MAMTPQRRLARRGYDAKRRATKQSVKWLHSKRWAARRAHQLAIEPLCRMCLKKDIVKAANTADHVVPHREDEHAFFHGALASLCRDCHSMAKQREEVRGYVDDLDADGWPADERHPANGGVN